MPAQNDHIPTLDTIEQPGMIVPGASDPLAYYTDHSLVTDPGAYVSCFADLPTEIPALCAVVQGLLIHPLASHLYGEQLSSLRKQDLQTRRVSKMLKSLLEIDDRPLTVPRTPRYRMAGNCRDYAVLLCSILRHQGVPARARVGFGAYLGHMAEDHWLCEYWDVSAGRWVLVDAEMDEVISAALPLRFDPFDTPRDQFIIAGDAWQMCRDGRAEWKRFGFKRWRGRAFVGNSAIRDLVSLNKIELLPWDHWWDKKLLEALDNPLSQERLAYIDAIADLALAGDDAFPALRAAYERDALISDCVEERYYKEEVRDKRALQGSLSLSELQRQWAEVTQVRNIARTYARSYSGIWQEAGSKERRQNLEPDKIVVRGAQQHNLKNIDVTIPRYKLVVLTGVSGSGKSSLAFDIIYAEGQRRYVESLSPFVRHFLEKVDKPKVDFIGGLSPAISIEQKTVSKNPRSTVGTVTEVMHYIRLLYSRIGTAHCLRCGSAIEPAGAREIAGQLASWLAHVSASEQRGHFPCLLAQAVRQRKGSRSELLEQARREGCTQARIDGAWLSLNPLPVLSAGQKHDIDLLVADAQTLRDAFNEDDPQQARLLSLVQKALRLGDGTLLIDLGGSEITLSEKRLCPTCGESFPELTSQHFSPNSPFGMCPDCNGLGTKLEVDPALIVQDPAVSIMDGALRWYGNLRKKQQSWPFGELQSVAEHYGADLVRPWQDLPQRFRDALLYGSGEEKIRITHHNERREGAWSGEAVRPLKGLVYNINRLFRQTKSDGTRRYYASFMSQQPCATCNGARLSAEVRAVTLGGKAINEIGSLTIDRVLAWIDDLSETLSDEQLLIADEALRETRDRLQFMLNVGLHYLALDRPAPSLSGGEGQRIRLASQLGCGLVGVLYVLDEPSIGLHARDQRTLLDTLLQLRDMGNTVLVVEHDAETMLSADWLIDLGPGAGILGGEVVAVGTPQEVAANPRSLTGRYLSGSARVSAPKGSQRREPRQGWLSVQGASLHNLKHITARFPLGLLTCVTGVSGGGKSSLINGTLYPALMRSLHREETTPGPYERLEGVEALNKVINVTQDPIGRTPRSNPATYIGAFDEIRKVFAATPEARQRGYGPDRFSFNVAGGRCEACKGYGQKVIEMHFLADVWVPCKECGGTRFNHETLAIRYNGKNIAEVLDMDVQEALTHFADHPRLAHILGTLHAVGLDYIKLGQSATTLSGGEAQRVKLARELSRASTGRTLYILDEPTTGLHFADIQRLLDVLHRLVDAGNTVIVIEHNLDVIKTADWLIDLGPEGGDDGGHIVAQGAPEHVATVRESHTGRFLRDVLAMKQKAE